MIVNARTEIPIVVMTALINRITTIKASLERVTEAMVMVSSRKRRRYEKMRKARNAGIQNTSLHLTAATLHISYPTRKEHSTFRATYSSFD